MGYDPVFFPMINDENLSFSQVFIEAIATSKVDRSDLLYLLAHFLYNQCTGLCVNCCAGRECSPS